MRYCILRLLFLVATIIVSVHAFAQDLLTEQAPMDEKMVRIDSVVLSRFVKAEVYEYPADDLYPEWSNDYAHKYANVVIPEGGRNLVALDMILGRIQKHLDGMSAV